MIEDKSLYDLVYLSFLFLGVFIISLLIIPKIRRLSIKLNFTDIPDSRSSHTSSLSSFGGVAFYISYIIVLFFSQSLDIHYVSLTLLVSISIFFFMGLFDDIREAPAIYVIKEWVKLGAKIKVYDPKVFNEAKEHYLKGVQNITYVTSKNDVLKDSDALVLLTEWKGVSFTRFCVNQSAIKNTDYF
jgi:hypothetical protein